MILSLAAQVGFWVSVAALVYAYLGYPVLVFAVSRVRPREIKRADADALPLPPVSVIITAYNEERALPGKLANTLALDYPSDKLEIIVASDCSSDRTDQITRDFAHRSPRVPVRLDRQAHRAGKTSAQNSAVELARGDIILFSDATTLYDSQVLRRMIVNFADGSVGCVAGRLDYVDPTRSATGHGAQSYWGYETFLKRCESRAGSLIGASGCLYAVRRRAYIPMYAEACSDFLIATKMVEQGLRAVYEPAAFCTEETNRRTDKEFWMRVRVITQTYTDLWRHRRMMNPFRSGFYGVQLVSHKLLRYMVPLLLVINFVCAALALKISFIYFAATLAHLSLYAAAFVGWFLERSGHRTRLFALPLYFMLANLAALVALYKFAQGERFARWEPIREADAAESQASSDVAKERVA